MSTRRYRWRGVDPDDLNNLIEAGSGPTLEFLQRTPWTEVTVVDGTRDEDLDGFMEAQGYVVDATGPTIIVTAAGAYAVGTEQTVLVDATLGPVTVDLPLTTTRLGNDVLVMKIDSSVNAVTVTRSGGDTIDGSVTQVLTQQNDAIMLVADATTANWHISSSRRATDINYVNTAPITSTNVGDALTEIFNSDLTSIKIFVAGEAITAGDLLTFNTSGEVVRADSSIAGSNWEVIGVANETVLIGATIEVVTKSGACPIVRFAAAPAGALNGRLVFISSSSGLATATPPTTTGNTLFTIGTLQGADGATMTPVVLFRPQFIAHRR
jgi:hypothetical protein